MIKEKTKKFTISALGCRTNQYEAQAFRDQLLALGYTQAEEGEEADVCIVNTCTVTESADSNSRHLVRSLIKQNPNAKMMVTGCLAENKPATLKAIGGVHEVVSNKDKEKLIQLMLPEEQNVPEFAIKQFDAHTRAFVKVQDGCNSFCTYCIIPYVRGRSRSRTIAEVVQEVEGLIASGFKEVVITGINVGDFDGNVEPPQRLVDLIRAVDAIPGLKRLRISSIDPDEVDDDLLDAVINGKNTCHSMHIVLQAGSNMTLKRMNRKYTRQQFFETVRRLTAASPDFTFTTDIIVGFPGETDADFEETLDVMRQVRFAKVHMFPYSVRERTRAALYPNKVPHDVIQERKAKVLALSEQLAFEMREAYVGRTMEVLTESQTEGDYTCGHTANFLPVLVPKRAANELITVKLVKNTPEGLIGDVT
ncbi:MAG: tRNA (N(6)-L-threonylcarbamoyladenosine(37)-C(2))-methylthiotransferase MtaB [Verrucomicrobia bacterium]|nr:tRNA (N(6)-L-threonylcarbamoyladenosine(37)-C(2))-methylthiotransferase MtaB [Verrucomicrobiota bacterium]MBS0636417.1 tRNA (N(6)-L-threonylcarbamoyladenosine(37)-C(2))-methylthiotransferase MtaB [Verrucomicrobiota bacterium]